MEQLIARDKEVLIKNIKEYVNIIKKEFKDYVQIPDNIVYNEIVHIEETGTISLFIRDGEFYFPIAAYKTLETFKGYANFGSDKNHKIYTEETLLINDNDFLSYISHLILIGATPLEYFQEILLHETMHFCGSNGSTALMEGLNEYLTRIVALKYNLKTNGCGYPKEIKIILELEELFGTETLIKLAFSKSQKDICQIFGTSEAINFFLSLDSIMNKEFYEKYYKFKYPGPNGPFEKAKRYGEIDYSNAMGLIEEYKTKNSIKR